MVYVFQEGIPRELRCAHGVSWVQLVLVEQVVTEHLEHVGQQTNVVQEVELNIILKALRMKVREHLLGVGVIGIGALHVYELVE